MSVIVWDGKTLAADRLAEVNGTPFRVSKTRQLADGTVLAWTGIHPMGLIMADWYEAGANLKEYPPQQADKEDWTLLIVVKPTGQVFKYERFPIAVGVLDYPAAWGSGRDAALGAMKMGADARRAVEIASELDINCGLGIEAYDVKHLELAAAGD